MTAASALRRLTDGVIPQAVITGSLSFAHIHDLALRHGQTGWKAWTYPLSVDLLMVAAYREVLKARHAKNGGTVLPWVWFLLSLAASLTANVIATGGRDPLSIAVGVWPAIAFLGCTLLGHANPAPVLNASQSAEAVESASESAAAVGVRVEHVQAVAEVPAPAHAVESSSIAALAPAEPKPLAPAPVPAPPAPEVPSDLLDYATRIASDHHARHGQPIPLAALRARLGVAPALAQTIHTHVTA